MKARPYNPLDPVFTLKNAEGVVEEYGVIKGSKPKQQYYRTNPKERDLELKARDIKGNEPGTAMMGAFHTRERKDYHETAKNDDIVGSGPNTLVTGIKVPQGAIARKIFNPLEPKYQYPGATEY